MKSCLALILLFVCGCAESQKNPELKVYPYEDGIYVLPWGARLVDAENRLRMTGLPFSSRPGVRWHHSISSLYALDTLLQGIPNTEYSSALRFVDSVLVTYVLHLHYTGDYEQNFLPHVKQRATEELGPEPWILTARNGMTIRFALSDWNHGKRTALLLITAEDVLRLAEESAARKDADPSRL